jgi:hypothetical protein
MHDGSDYRIEEFSARPEALREAEHGPSPPLRFDQKSPIAAFNVVSPPLVRCAAALFGIDHWHEGQEK